MSLNSIAKYLQKKYVNINIKTYTLRYWEKNFKNIKPVKVINKRKYFDKKSIFEIEKIIYLLKIKKYSIEGVKNFIKKQKKALDVIDKNNVDTDTIKTTLEFKVKMLSERVSKLKNRWQKKAQ